MQFYEGMSSIPKERLHRVTLQGTGNGTVPTVVAGGQRIAVTWVATGRLLFKWSDPPGTFIGLNKPMFGDATQSNVKQWTATRGTWDKTNYQIEVDIWNSSGNAADLAATSFMDLSFIFSEISLAKSS